MLELWVGVAVRPLWQATMDTAPSEGIVSSAVPTCDVVERLTTSGACPINVLARDVEKPEQQHHPSCKQSKPDYLGGAVRCIPVDERHKNEDRRPGESNSKHTLTQPAQLRPFLRVLAFHAGDSSPERNTMPLVDVNRRGC